jgi:hypothetical protein
MESEVMRQQVGENEFRSWISGRQLCGLRWVCAACSAKRAEADREFVNAALAAARETRGLFVVMLTLTTRHKKREDARAIVTGLAAAEQGLKELKSWRNLKKSLTGYARCFEWTWGEKHGHHPHFHTVMLVRAPSEAEAIAKVERLRGPYLRQLTAAGRDGASKAARTHSFHVQAGDAAERYVTKWGCAEELTGAKAKEASGENLTPWQLLRLSRTETDPKKAARHAAIWWEIMQATKGRAQLFKSEGFKVLAQQWLDQQPEPEAKPEPESVRSLGVREKGRKENTAIFDQARKRSLGVREAAENHADLAAAQAAVVEAMQGLTDVEIIAGIVHDPDDDLVLSDLLETEGVDNHPRAKSMA